VNRAGRRVPLWVRGVVPLAAIAVLVAGWAAVVAVFGIPSYVLPSPAETVAAITADWPELSRGALATTQVFVAGFLAGTAGGFLVAVVMAQVDWVRRALYPILIASQAVPIIAIGAALVIWLGFGLAPKLVIVALIVFFPVVVNVLDGLAAVDEDMVDLARAMGASRRKIFVTVRLPATYTPLFSALKMTATFSVTGAVLGEQAASSSGGLGTYLAEQQSRLNAPAVFGDIVLLAVIGIVAFALIAGLEWLATPWRRGSLAPKRRRYRPAADPAQALDVVRAG